MKNIMRLWNKEVLKWVWNYKYSLSNKILNNLKAVARKTYDFADNTYLCVAKTLKFSRLLFKNKRIVLASLLYLITRKLLPNIKFWL